MKKLCCVLFFMILCCVNASAATADNTPINVNIDDIFSASGYYCLEVFVGYDKETGCGIPTRLGPGFINRYLAGITASKKNYIKFAYSLPQPNGYWPSNPKYICQFTLDKSASLTVNVGSTYCSIKTSKI